jgi:hypothetical protein
MSDEPARLDAPRAASVEDELEAALSDDERAMLDDLAARIAKRRMIAPALFLLESSKPLAFASSQLLLFFRPIVGALWTNPSTYDRIQSVLERRGSLELLLRRLEARA